MAKSANLLVDTLSTPDRIGILLPLHWQTVSLLLAGVATGARVVLAAAPEDLVGCGAAFVRQEHAQAVLDVGVDDVLALSGHPLGAPAGPLPSTVLDYAREVPSHADYYGGPRPMVAHIEVGGQPVRAAAGIGAGDRVLTTLTPASPTGAAVLLGALAAGASLILLAAGDADAVAATERATATAGITAAGLTRLA